MLTFMVYIKSPIYVIFLIGTRYLLINEEIGNTRLNSQMQLLKKSPELCVFNSSLSAVSWYLIRCGAWTWRFWELV